MGTVLVPVETEEQKRIRLELERRQELADAENRRAVQTKEDAIPYLLLLSIQFLPLVSTDRAVGIFYLFGIALGTVYVGGRQEVITPAEQVKKENALVAPIFASFSILILYALLKSGIDPTALYAFGVSAFGVIAIPDIGVPLLRNLLPASFSSTEIEVPEKIAIRSPNFTFGWVNHIGHWYFVYSTLLVSNCNGTKVSVIQFTNTHSNFHPILTSDILVIAWALAMT